MRRSGAFNMGSSVDPNSAGDPNFGGTPMRRSGVILVAVLLIVSLAGMVAAGLLFRMHSAVAASAAIDQGEEAYSAAMSGVRRAMYVLKEFPDDMDMWHNNEELFSGQLVHDDGSNKWYFTVYAPDLANPGEIRYGLIDEGGKISLSSASEETLLALPNMTPELVDCLMDYCDQDDDVRQYGSEQSYYNSLEYPYMIKNGPLATLEELLIVKGFSAFTVYGEDYNFNGLLDENEDDGDISFPPDNADGILDAGLRQIATGITASPNSGGSGGKVDINRATYHALSGLNLPDGTARFIDLVRKDGYRFSSPSDLVEMRYVLKNDRTDAEDNTVYAGTPEDSYVSRDDLASVNEQLSVGGGGPSIVFGMLNVNTASKAALMAVEGIDEVAAQRIVDTRESMDSDMKSKVSWVRDEGILDQQSFSTASRMLTTKSYQYRVQCIGFGRPSGRIRVLEAVIDLMAKKPRIVYLRDITRLGVPFELAVESEE